MVPGFYGIVLLLRVGESVRKRNNDRLLYRDFFIRSDTSCHELTFYGTSARNCYKAKRWWALKHVLERVS